MSAVSPPRRWRWWRRRAAARASADSPAVHHRRRRAAAPGRGTPRPAAKGTGLARAGIHLRCTVDRVLAGERPVDPAGGQPSCIAATTRSTRGA